MAKRIRKDMVTFEGLGEIFEIFAFFDQKDKMFENQGILQSIGYKEFE
jgi:hypothetical protein